MEHNTPVTASILQSPFVAKQESARRSKELRRQREVARKDEAVFSREVEQTQESQEADLDPEHHHAPTVDPKAAARHRDLAPDQDEPPSLDVTA